MGGVGGHGHRLGPERHADPAAVHHPHGHGVRPGEARGGPCEVDAARAGAGVGALREEREDVGPAPPGEGRGHGAAVDEEGEGEAAARGRLVDRPAGDSDGPVHGGPAPGEVDVTKGGGVGGGGMSRSRPNYMNPGRALELAPPPGSE